MQSPILLQNKIPFQVERKFLESSPFFHGDPNRKDIIALWQTGLAIARPKAVALRVAVQVGATGNVEALGGKAVRSPLLDRNLAGQEETFVYAATCGQELAHLDPGPDAPCQAALFVLRMQALAAAQNHLIHVLQEQFHTLPLAAMNPGSLPIWPLSQQKPIFTLLGEGLTEIGLTLDPQGVLQPMESAYGILFETKQPYENCMLCENISCPGRRAGYDKTMAALYR